MYTRVYETTRVPCFVYTYIYIYILYTYIYNIYIYIYTHVRVYVIYKYICAYRYAYIYMHTSNPASPSLLDLLFAASQNPRGSSRSETKKGFSV